MLATIFIMVINGTIIMVIKPYTIYHIIPYTWYRQFTIYKAPGCISFHLMQQPLETFLSLRLR